MCVNLSLSLYIYINIEICLFMFILVCAHIPKEIERLKRIPNNKNTMANEVIEECFGLFDRDNDGYLTSSEFKTVFLLSQRVSSF